MADLRAIAVTAFLDLDPYHEIIRRVPLDWKGATQTHQHSYVEMWETDDGRIRHELLPNGRYDEARGTRKNAYQGRHEVKGNHIDY